MINGSEDHFSNFIRHQSVFHFNLVSEECRTRWLNGDDPSDEGDVESIPQLIKTFPSHACRNPIGIEAKTTYGISAKNTRDIFLSYDVTFGFACINKEQEAGRCEDYQVLLTCPSDFCQGCRTRWFDFDNPTGRGDYETLLQLEMVFPNEVCSQPVAIEAMTVSATGQTRNPHTPGGRRCQDYKVRFTCPLSFCLVHNQWS
uniref:WxxW domain-containing protein n=1 Tax=Myripristis murdjan TaxID=586833 RepID=A0A667Z8R1_9TELE